MPAMNCEAGGSEVVLAWKSQIRSFKFEGVGMYASGQTQARK